MTHELTILDQQRIIRSVSQGDYLINLATVLRCISEQPLHEIDQHELERISAELVFVCRHFEVI